MGSLDANGIWQYDGNDHFTPTAAWGNLLAGSVSDAFADFRAELTAELEVPDSGWINLPSSVTPVSGYTPRYRKIGDVVYVEGRVTNIQGTFTIGTLPSGFRTSRPILDLGNFAINDSQWRRIYMSNVGEISAGSIQGGTSTQANFCFSFIAG